MYNENDLKNKSKEQLIELYLDLQDEYNSLDESYGELESNIDDLQERCDILEYENNKLKINAILDLQLFKDKLHLYDLDTEELLNFIDDYMRLYNKE